MAALTVCHVSGDAGVISVHPAPAPALLVWGVSHNAQVCLDRVEWSACCSRPDHEARTSFACHSNSPSLSAMLRGWSGMCWCPASSLGGPVQTGKEHSYRAGLWQALVSNPGFLSDPLATQTTLVFAKGSILGSIQHFHFPLSPFTYDSCETSNLKRVSWHPV